MDLSPTVVELVPAIAGLIAGIVGLFAARLATRQADKARAGRHR